MPLPVVLIDPQQLAARVAAMAGEIRAALPDDDIHFVCVLKGAFVFLADLVRALDDRVTMDFIAVSSYGAGQQSSGEVRLVKDVDTSLEGRHVIIVEDIVDSGLTLHYLQDILRLRGPLSLRTACLLNKPSRRKVDVQVDFVGFTIEDHFVVGYGLDVGEKYRNLPYIGVFEL
jgi:hypoxanthine phosphoribosyltransferase